MTAEQETELRKILERRIVLLAYTDGAKTFRSCVCCGMNQAPWETDKGTENHLSSCVVKKLVDLLGVPLVRPETWQEGSIPSPWSAAPKESKP